MRDHFIRLILLTAFLAVAAPGPAVAAKGGEKDFLELIEKSPVTQALTWAVQPWTIENGKARPSREHATNGESSLSYPVQDTWQSMIAFMQRLAGSERVSLNTKVRQDEIGRAGKKRKRRFVRIGASKAGGRREFARFKIGYVEKSVPSANDDQAAATDESGKRYEYFAKLVVGGLKVKIKFDPGRSEGAVGAAAASEHELGLEEAFLRVTRKARRGADGAPHNTLERKMAKLGLATGRNTTMIGNRPVERGLFPPHFSYTRSAYRLSFEQRTHRREKKPVTTWALTRRGHYEAH